MVGTTMHVFMPVGRAVVRDERTPLDGQPANGPPKFASYRFKIAGGAIDTFLKHYWSARRRETRTSKYYQHAAVASTYGKEHNCLSYTGTCASYDIHM
eukprot:6184625-Pleurochrysis_carterae.AAC.4